MPKLLPSKIKKMNTNSFYKVISTHVFFNERKVPDLQRGDVPFLQEA
jgi:hypothetical protein